MVASRPVPQVKQLVRGISVKVAQEAAQQALQAQTAVEAEAILRRAAEGVLGDAPFLRYGMMAMEGDLNALS